MSQTTELNTAPALLGRAVRALRPWALLTVVGGLSSCGGYNNCDNCYNYTPSEVSYGLVAADFNGNGFTSIVQTSTVKSGFAPYPGNLKAYLSTGAGAFAAPVLTSDGDNPLYLATADLNGDHLSDIVSASYEDGTLAVFFNDAQSPGTFNSPLVLSSPGASQVAIGDMNGDGLPDLVSADYNVSLFLQTSPGTFASPIPLYSGGANWVAVGDLNGDGIPDVALTDNVGVKVLMHTGAAAATTYAAPVTVFTQTANAAFSGANLIAIADVNGDGLNDLVITDPGPAGGAAPTVSVLLQDPAHPGQFLPAVSYATAAGSLAQSIVVADVSGDGLPDIVIGGDNAVSVLLQDPSTPGTFLAATNYPVEDANQIAIADVNGDGLVDIIIATGPTHPSVGGVITNHPGVLLQSATAPGTFTALQDLP
ncbi:MAG: FG-GAP repeat domain-containing protein [Steroidobacteraceae bacterium]